MVKPPADLKSFESFVSIVEALRGPDGCPWDKEQTHRTLAPYAIEEAFELADAIEAAAALTDAAALAASVTESISVSVKGSATGLTTVTSAGGSTTGSPADGSATIGSSTAPATATGGGGNSVGSSAAADAATAGSGKSAADAATDAAVADAATAPSPEDLKAAQAEIVGELGDLLLQVVLNAEIAKQDGRFTLEDVIFSISEKMVRRHPHVFADTQVSGVDEIWKNWDEIKKQEKAKKKAKPGFDIPVGMPALSRAQKIGQKTKAQRFDWKNTSGVWAKVEEELAELREAMHSETRERQEAELGDLMFSLAQLARHLDFDAEQALRTTNQRFEARFFKMQSLAAAEGRDFATLGDEELEKYWKRAK